MNQLELYGITPRFTALAAEYPEMTVGRVSSQYRDLYKVVTAAGELLAEVSGRFRHEARHIRDFPAVGDFVMLDRERGENGNGIIHHVLPRKSAFVRRAVGAADETQIVAANIDTVLICMSPGHDFNPRRLERYLSVAWDSGALPVVVLTKADLCENLSERLAEISSVAIGVEIIATSHEDAESWRRLLPYLGRGATASFIGSSGVGKSTLINCLAGETVFSTGITRKDDKGRHTTTRREMLLLPGGGVVIDTPGMRELGVDAVDLTKSFADIDELAGRCRFKDCGHQSEPGCAVRAAIENGELDPRRFESYLKLQKEAKYDGLNSRQIEAEKISAMFAGFGGIKNARKYIQEKNKRKSR